MTQTVPDALSIAPTTRGPRITGIDLARALAMLGMVIAHYAWPDESDTALDSIATLVMGRAMPLFVLLGGIGATMLTARSRTPDRALLLRAAMLLPLGLLLQELTTFIAIILQYYALFFALTPLFRRIPTRPLLGVAVAVAVFGTWSFQVIGPRLDTYRGPADLIDNPVSALWSLLFNGYYPFFPVASFFLVGLAVGRLDLRSPRLARNLAGVGAAVGIGTVIAANLVIDGLSVDRDGFESNEGDFSLARLLDTSGHSEMLTWVLSATGTSLAILGLCLLITPRLSIAAQPFISLGQLALTFYVFQAILVRFTPHPDLTPLSQEFVTALAIFFGFMVFATIWRLRFRHGPLEAGLRLGSRR